MLLEDKKVKLKVSTDAGNNKECVKISNGKLKEKSGLQANNAKFDLGYDPTISGTQEQPSNEIPKKHFQNLPTKVIFFSFKLRFLT